MLAPVLFLEYAPGAMPQVNPSTIVPVTITLDNLCTMTHSPLWIRVQAQVRREITRRIPRRAELQLCSSAHSFIMNDAHDILHAMPIYRLFAVCLLAVPALAQTAALRGQVTDESGAL